MIAYAASSSADRASRLMRTFVELRCILACPAESFNFMNLVRSFAMKFSTFALSALLALSKMLATSQAAQQ
jgi:hypothetical protein